MRRTRFDDRLNRRHVDSPPQRELVTYPGERVAHDDAPAKVRQLVAGRQTVEATESVLPVGSEIQIVGHKSTTADATGAARDYRQPPQRATLQSGPQLPLVIVRADEAPGRTL